MPSPAAATMPVGASGAAGAADAAGPLGWGGVEPGTPEPGTSEPGTPEPGTPEPGTSEPGTPEPGTPEPGTSEPAAWLEPGTAAPALPAPKRPTTRKRLATRTAPTALIGAPGSPRPEDPDIFATYTSARVRPGKTLGEAKTSGRKVHRQLSGSGQYARVPPVLICRVTRPTRRRCSGGDGMGTSGARWM